MTGSTGDISTENLERHKIYVKDVHNGDQDSDSTSALPAHVDALREALLVFSNTIPNDWKDVFDAEFEQYGSKIPDQHASLQPPDAAYFTDLKDKLRKLSPKSTAAHENNECCQEIAVKARGKTQELETGWNHFLRVNVFGDFDANKDNTLRSDINAFFDQWSLQGNFKWTAFQDWQELIPGLTKRTIPTPDLTYGFPIISSWEGLPKGFVRDDYIQSFSLDVLAKLRSHKVYSTTTKGLKSGARTRKAAALKAHDLLCFPWAVVEMKYSSISQDKVEYCYCQAANASAAALRLQEQLFEHAYGDSPKNLPPIIAFTCIGPCIKVWLTYRVEGASGSSTIMRCIWSTSLELTWGVVALRHMIQSMHIWSSRILRPKLGVAISRVIEKLLRDPISFARRFSRDQSLLHVPSPPRTPGSSRHRRRSRTRSLSVQSHQSDELNSDDNTTLIDSSTEFSSPGYDSDKEEDESSDGDWSDDTGTRSSSRKSEDVTFLDETFSSDSGSEYSSEASSSESDDEHHGDEEQDFSEEKTGSKYTDEELEDRRRLSLTLLTGAQFARLDVLDKRFDGLFPKQKVNLIWNLLKPFNTARLRLGLADRELLQRLLDTLNAALGKAGSEKDGLTMSNLHTKKSGGRIRHALRNYSSEPETLKCCLCCSLHLYSDETHRVHTVIAEDLEILSDEDIKQMEEQAFKLLNQDDQQNDMLP